MKKQFPSRIFYFDHEGRQNLPQVINSVKVALTKRPELRSFKLVIFTASGEGPALAYNRLRQFDPKIIAVTFPPGFVATRTTDVGEIQIPARISDKLMRFFHGVGVTILTGRLPFDPIEGCDAATLQMKLVKDVLSVFGGGFSLCVQAVLQACDMGALEIGERVIAITGDSAAVITASTTAKFLSVDEGLSINEILCKPRNFNIVRRQPPEPVQPSLELFAETETRLLPPSVDVE